MKKLLMAAMAAMAALSFAAAAYASTGLSGAYYNGLPYLDNVNNTAWAMTQTPFATFTANTVCFPDCYGGSVGDGSSLSQFLDTGGGNASNLSADQTGVGGHVLLLNGTLNLTTTDLYQFYVDSDDGSWMKIDGNVVVDDDGQHAMTGVWGGTVALSAGAHSIEITQWENGGGTGLNAWMFEYGNGAENPLSGAELSFGGAPEPSTWALMIMGLAATGGLLRRRTFAAA